MLAVADRLMQEFENVPVITVIRALGNARSALREIGEPVTPEAVESLTRARLVISHAPVQLTDAAPRKLASA